MTEYQFVRPQAFQLASQIQHLPHQCSTLQFPLEMKRRLRYELTRVYKRPPEQVRLPIAALNKAMRMLIPGITSVTPGADLETTETWLYGHEKNPASPQALRLIMDAWINTAFTALKPEEREQLADEIIAMPLQWERRDIDLAQWEQGSNGTAQFSRTRTELDGFVLLPDFIAAQITTSESDFHWGEQPLHFRRVPAYGNGIELISWPPLLYYESEQRVWPFSVLLTLSAQTIPFQAYPILNCDIGIRRWAGPRITRFPLKDDTSIYLADQVPWITSVAQSRSFQVAPASWERIPEYDRKGKDTHQLVWNSTLVPILNRLHITEQDKLPSPEDLRNTPMQYMSFNGSPSAAIVYRNGIQPAHEVGTGLMPVDRYHFIEQLKKKLAPILELHAPYERRKIQLTVPDNLFFPDKKKIKKESIQTSDIQAQRRQIIASQCKGVLFIEIWYQAQRMRQALLQALQDTIGGDFSDSAQEKFTITTNELKIVISTYLLGDLGAVLTIPTEKKERRPERIREAIRQRVHKIEASLPENSEHTLAFIELDDDDSFPEDRDPKPALRKGFAQGGRLTQFITPYQEEEQWSERRQKAELESLEHRAESAVEDLLRQLGTLSMRPNLQVNTKENTLHLPTTLHYLAVWLIKQQQASSATHIAQLVPVFVHMDSSSQDILVFAPGFLDWLIYPDAQLALAQDHYTGFSQKEDARQFILSTLNRYLPAFQDTLLLCHSQNLRSTWEWLANDKITKTLPPVLEKHQKLRIIRMRTGSLEATQWYAESEKEPYATTQGIFQIGESGHVFGSIQGKPPTATISKSASKMFSREGINKQKQLTIYPPDPTLAAWNPSLGEMTFIGTNSAEASLYASVADQLRHGFMVQFEYGLILPFPLHLAQQLEAYVLPTNALVQQLLGNGEEQGMNH